MVIACSFCVSSSARRVFSSKSKIDGDDGVMMVVMVVVMVVVKKNENED